MINLSISLTALAWSTLLSLTAPSHSYPLPSCQVISSSYSTIKCYTPPVALAPPPAPITLTNGTGLYPGMRGVWFQFYNVTVSSSFSLLDVLPHPSPSLFLSNPPSSLSPPSPSSRQPCLIPPSFTAPCTTLIATLTSTSLSP